VVVTLKIFYLFVAYYLSAFFICWYVQMSFFHRIWERGLLFTSWSYIWFRIYRQ